MRSNAARPQSQRCTPVAHDLSGQRFTRLTVLALDPSRPGRTWVCRCDCGETVSVRQAALLRGNNKSCGCLAKEARSNGARDRNKTHGLTSTPEWRAWSAMRQRCLNPNHKAFARYGGRGIGICPEWSSFEKFLADMGPRPSPEMTLERTNNSLGYCLSNCVWANRTQQQRNRRNTIMVTVDGESRPLVAVCEERSLNYNRVYERIARRGWHPERALLLP